MHPNQSKLESRVHRAAEAALSRQLYVSAIDVFCGMGLLAPAQVDSWRKGRVDFLERVIQGNLKKISSSMAIFRRWANEKCLKPSETHYMRRSRAGTVALQFSKSGDPGIERNYRTHYVSPALSEKKQQRLEEKLNQPPKPVVFQNLHEAQCSECGAEIEQGSFLSMELEQPLCRSRGRYERQGILVETAGLEKAERECLEDADERAVARARGAERRRKQDVELAAQMMKQIAMLFPGCPASEVAVIAGHTAQRGSGRVGRTEAGRNLQESALTLAVVAAIRHRHTQYDELLASGVDRVTARQRIADRVEEILARWQK